MKFARYLMLLCYLLFAGGTMMAQDTHWTYDANAFEYDMTTYPTVEYNGNHTLRADDMHVAVQSHLSVTDVRTVYKHNLS